MTEQRVGGWVPRQGRKVWSAAKVEDWIAR
jgi:hypothetical protein